MGRGKARSSRDLPKPINPKGRKMIGFGLWLMGFGTSAFTRVCNARAAQPILRAAPLQPAEPVEAAIRPEAARKGVGDLDTGDPFWILESEFGRGAQAQRETEWIRNGLTGIFGRENCLRM